MKHVANILHASTVLVIATVGVGFASAQAPIPAVANDTSEALKALDQVIEQNRKLEQQNRQLINQNQQLMDQVKSLRQAISASEQPAPGAVPQNGALPAVASEETPPAENPVAQNAVESQNTRRTWGTYTPNMGYKVANTEYGDMSISIYTYARYLNQRNLDPTYTDAFGNVKNVQQRQDLQLNKVLIKFLGWVLSEKFRYFVYAWTSNPTQG